MPEGEAPRGHARVRSVRTNQYFRTMGFRKPADSSLVRSADVSEAPFVGPTSTRKKPLGAGATWVWKPRLLSVSPINSASGRVVATTCSQVVPSGGSPMDCGVGACTSGAGGGVDGGGCVAAGAGLLSAGGGCDDAAAGVLSVAGAWAAAEVVSAEVVGIGEERVPVSGTAAGVVCVLDASTVDEFRPTT